MRTTVFYLLLILVSIGCTVFSGDTAEFPWQLFDASPNPFNPTTTIAFSIPETQHVRLYVTNIRGQLVERLLNETVSAGAHEVIFDANTLSSGIYFYTIEVGQVNETRQMVLIN